MFKIHLLTFLWHLITQGYGLYLQAQTSAAVSLCFRVDVYRVLSPECLSSYKCLQTALLERVRPLCPALGDNSVPMVSGRSVAASPVRHPLGVGPTVQQLEPQEPALSPPRRGQSGGSCLGGHLRALCPPLDG